VKILSLGAGVQSTTLALMAARDVIERPDYAIFADTGGEPEVVYKHLDWLETVLPFPVIRARRAGPTLAELAINIAHNPISQSAKPPWYTLKNNKTGMMSKQCTKEFKVSVVRAEIRKLLGVKPKMQVPRDTVVEQWLGISTDEAHRMKPADASWLVNKWPLIELNMARSDCLAWMKKNKYPLPPKSSCIFCPYRSDQQHKDLRDNSPTDWQKLLEIDAAIRPGFYGFGGQAFVHRSLLPMADVDLRSWEEKGQPDLFGEECEGMCGV
jgi:hypothetical protein